MWHGETMGSTYKVRVPKAPEAEGCMWYCGIGLNRVLIAFTCASDRCASQAVLVLPSVCLYRLQSATPTGSTYEVRVPKAPEAEG